MTQYSAASIYGLGDRMDDTAFQRWLDFHKRLKYPPRFITLFTAAKFEQAPSLLRRVRDSLPNTTPIWRGYDGKDAWGNLPPAGLEWDDSNFYLRLRNTAMTSPRMAAGLWFERRVKPYLGVIRETGAIIHLLNEAAAIFNAAYETECIRLLGEEGIRAGAFAWAAGTPDWPDYLTQVIEDQVAMAAKYKALVLTHEYAGFKPEEQNSLVNRNATLVKLFPKDQPPDVYIGEFALAKASVNRAGGVYLDPASGWRDMGINASQYVSGFIVPTAKAWYVPNKVSFSVYSGEDWGHNGSFGVMSSGEFLDLLVANSETLSFSVEDAMPTATASPIVINRPPEAQIGIRAKIVSIPAEFRNLRADHNYAAAIDGTVQAGDIVRRFDIPAYDGQVSPTSTGKWVFVEKLDGNNVVASGWVWRDRVQWESVTGSTQETPVVVAPVPDPTAVLPPPPQETWPTPPVVAPVTTTEPPPTSTPAAPNKTWLRYGLEIQTTAENHAAIELALITVFNALAVLGQAVGGSQVKITSDAVA